MEQLVFPPRMYTFLWEIKESKLEKKILDCGAGGNIPPLAIFHQHGFETHGIEISDDQIERATKFCQKHDINLNIVKGDMRKLEYSDESFSHVFSQNSIFHLTKVDTATAMSEMKRVLRTDGYLYVNFISVEDQGYGIGEEAGPGEWIALEREVPTLHSYYHDNEPDAYFEDMNIVLKIMNRTEFDNGKYRMVTIAYIARRM
ncbi:MAG: class I SAM-dependent methyltransferase [Candidatus Thorarchaeota archaeon]|nr:class I SAM-dependent methyltransferase [Candidatus Thorarchaeota archaeon]